MPPENVMDNRRRGDLEVDRSLARGYRRQFDRQITASASSAGEAIISNIDKYFDILISGKRLSKQDISKLRYAFQVQFLNKDNNICIIDEFSQTEGKFGLFTVGNFEGKIDSPELGRLINCVLHIQRRRILLYEINSRLIFDVHFMQRFFERGKSLSIDGLSIELEFLKCDRMFSVFGSLLDIPTGMGQPMVIPFGDGLALGVCIGQEIVEFDPKRVDVEAGDSPAISSVRFDQNGSEHTALPHPKINIINESRSIKGRMATFLPKDMLNDNQAILRDLLDQFYTDNLEAICELHKSIALCVVKDEKLKYNFLGAQRLLDNAVDLLTNEHWKHLKLPKHLYGKELKRQDNAP